MTAADVAELDLRIFPDRDSLGRSAAHDIAAELRQLLASQASARVVFASAPSQAETLAELARSEGIDWARVTAFHMDEYLGLSADAPQRFGTWLHQALFDRVPLGQVHLIDPDSSAAGSAATYAALLRQGEIDVTCLGIGVNGHIAFNDPAVADLDDPEAVKIVELDERSRIQQVDDGLFETIDLVPRRAITLTIPTLMSSHRLFCMVPGIRKADALRATVHEPVATTWPSTVLRTHPRCTVYADAEAASRLGAR